MEPNLSTVRARRAQIAQQRKALDNEDMELDIAEQVLMRLATMPNPSDEPAPEQSDAAGAMIKSLFTPAVPAPVTQRDLILATLRTVANPWVESSRDLQAAIEKAHGIFIRDSSLMPLLTGLKNDGLIRRDSQNRIALTDRISSLADAGEIKRRKLD